jgi:polysaccharide pyruvyl transferase WcaK-like protein
MPNERPRVFLYGYNGFGNVGDDLLLGSVIGHLRKSFKGLRFRARALGAVDAFEGDSEIDFVCSESILSDNSLPKWKRLKGYAVEFWNVLGDCSCLIFCGGTLFHARNGSPKNLLVLTILTVIARLRGAQVFAIGAGVHPLRGLSARAMMSLLLSLVKDFAVRDLSSLEACRGLLGSAKVRQASDLVFAMPLMSSPRLESRTPTLGLSVAASDIGGTVDSFPDFKAGFAIFVERIKAMGWRVVLISFQELDREGRKISDFELFKKIFGGAVKFPCIRISSHQETLTAQYAELTLVVGMRFHSLVLAAMLGKPFVGIGRDPKLSDLCNVFSMPFVGMEGFDPEIACRAVDVAQSNSPSGSVLSECRRLAAENFQNLDIYISGRHT